MLHVGVDVLRHLLPASLLVRSPHRYLMSQMTTPASTTRHGESLSLSCPKSVVLEFHAVSLLLTCAFNDSRPWTLTCKESEGTNESLTTEIV